MTAALEGGEWSATRPGCTLPPGKTRYPFYRRLGGSQDRSGRAENLVPTGIRSRTVQPVVICYSDWATRPTDQCSTRNLGIDSLYTRAEKNHGKTWSSGLRTAIHFIYIYIYIYICVCVLIFIYVYTHIHIHVCGVMCVYVRARIYVYVYIYKD